MWRLADGTLLAHPLDLSEPVWGVALHGNIIVTAVGGDIAIHQPSLHDPYEIASCSAASADRYDHRIMAGYQVQRGRPPVITPDVVRHPMRDSDTLSGTSAAEEP